MNFKEIKNLIAEIGGISSLMAHSEGDFDIDIKDFPKYKKIKIKNEYEEGNESIEAVIHFIKPDIYIKVTGYYSSYQGHRWSEKFSQVFPSEKIITVYTSKKQTK